MMNIGVAVPWSVPRLPFSSTRRPNSVKIMAATHAVVHRCLIAGGSLAHKVRALGRVLSRRGEEFKRRVRRRSRLAQLREDALLIVSAFASEARRIFKHERRMTRAANGERL